jgi:hypothetical protein
VAHNWSCATATRRPCECTGCGGAQHGWYGAIETARTGTSEYRATKRAEAEKAWDIAAVQAPDRRSKAKKTASIDAAVADLTEWLANNESVTDRVQVVGDALARSVHTELEESLGSAGLESFKSSSLDHFWCDLLATFACVIGRFKWWHKQAYEFAAEKILESRTSDGRSHLDEAVIRLAMRASWKAVSAAIPGLLPVHLTETLWAMRILAILLCPAPEEHKAVAKCCLDPITSFAESALRRAIASATRERLLNALPEDWLPATQMSLMNVRNGAHAFAVDRRRWRLR